MLALDIEKAFDTVWHRALLYKLHKINTPPYLVKIIQSYLDNRTFQIKINDTLSKKTLIPAGVPQGAVLSPTLFNIYINDIPKNDKTTLSLFADDTAILSTSKINKIAKANIITHINEIQQFFQKWKIKINKEKTQIVKFDLSPNSSPESINIFNQEIQIGNELTYLGVTLDKRLNFNSNTSKLIEKSRTAIRTLFPLINLHSKLNVNLRLYIYKTYIKPILLYACPVWGNTTRSNLKKLQVIQNKMLRLTARKRRATHINLLHSITNSQKIIPTINKLSIKFYNTITKLNPLTKEIGTINHHNRNFKKKRKLINSHILPPYLK